MTAERADHTTKSVDPWNLELGQRLRAAREDRQWSLASAAQRATWETTSVAIGSYERGDRMPSTRRIAQLADLYGVPVQTLIPAQRITPELTKEEA
jgi:transcriptional regulator with XRE-family HTH domain